MNGVHDMGGMDGFGAIECLPNEPVFHAPWEGRVLAMSRAEGAPDKSETYYRDWLATLEQMVTAKGLADAAALSRTRNAWTQAAERTPHGTSIELCAEDFC